MKLLKKSALRLLIFVISILPNCWLENELIFITLRNFPIAEIIKASGCELEFEALGYFDSEQTKK